MEGGQWEKKPAYVLKWLTYLFNTHTYKQGESLYGCTNAAGLLFQTGKLF